MMIDFYIRAYNIPRNLYCSCGRGMFVCTTQWASNKDWKNVQAICVYCWEEMTIEQRVEKGFRGEKKRGKWPMCHAMTPEQKKVFRAGYC